MTTNTRPLELSSPPVATIATIPTRTLGIRHQLCNPFSYESDPFSHSFRKRRYKIPPFASASSFSTRISDNEGGTGQISDPPRTRTIQRKMRPSRGRRRRYLGSRRVVISVSSLSPEPARPAQPLSNTAAISTTA
jgi:hypothetical protein